ncbi:hypothetical protein QR685DRAFT_341967 [Neurospora intermedia]|uniref:Secreted protein n=1 Tax=Neurospora intermedia TaxID=5142 RepID=A0ABR3D7Y0_NEUIN
MVSKRKRDLCISVMLVLLTATTIRPLLIVCPPFMDIAESFRPMVASTPPRLVESTYFKPASKRCICLFLSDFPSTSLLLWKPP